jgi:Protein of unknown function (DUF1552)
MTITGKHLSRRTLLRGVGVAIALPALDSMFPAMAAPAKAGGKMPVRLGFTYVPNGMTMADWTPQTPGAGFEMGPILKRFEPFRNDMLVLGNMMDHNGNALGDGGGDHARAGGSFLTGVHPKKTSGKDIQVGISVDQVAADAIGATTKVRSLELSCEDSRTVGNCDSGYSCAYSNSFSWRGPSTPNPPETNPRAVFERLFGGDDITLSAEVRLKRMADRRSILDMAQEQTKRIVAGLGAADKRKIDEYLTAVREVESKIQRAESAGVMEVSPDFERPTGVPFAYADYAKLMLDLAALAFQTDSARVVTIVFGREGSLRTYPEIGVPDGHHPLSHHGNRPESLAKLSLINQFHAGLYAQFLAKLKATQDGDGTLLDHCLLMYGSGLSDSNRHIHENLPIAVFGRGDGSVKSGRFISYEKPTPMTNLYMTMLTTAGVKAESIGDSTGKVEQLTDV